VTWRRWLHSNQSRAAAAQLYKQQQQQHATAWWWYDINQYVRSATLLG